MSQHPLTPAQAERLAFLAEECAEVIQAVGKILRHGYCSINPEAPEKGDNRWQLMVELGDVQAAVALMVDADDVDAWKIAHNQAVKEQKMGRYFHHQEGLIHGR